MDPIAQRLTVDCNARTQRIEAYEIDEGDTNGLE
jgi:hypothetical protein